MAGKTTPRFAVELTTNFERNLEDVERFLVEAEVPHAFDGLLDELTETVIPNLERFPSMGRAFLSRPILSVEASNGIDLLQAQLKKIGEIAELREYVTAHYLMLYACVGTTVYLLSIRHHRQLSFDFQGLWLGTP